MRCSGRDVDGRARRRACRASREVAMGTAALFACSDILLFSAGVAQRRAARRHARGGGMAGGRGARGDGTAPSRCWPGSCSPPQRTKVSYALPALAYFGWALLDRRIGRRDRAGAAPIVLLVGWLAAQAPEAFQFEVLTFPRWPRPILSRRRSAGCCRSAAKRRYVRFLALGTALPAIVAVVARWRQPNRVRRDCSNCSLAGLVAALLPERTWRQYSAVLPPLFVRLALAGRNGHHCAKADRVRDVRAPGSRHRSRQSLAVQKGAPMSNAITDGAMRGVMDKANIEAGRDANPQYLPATGACPIRASPPALLFRSHGLLDPAASGRSTCCPRQSGISALPQAVLVGGARRLITRRSRRNYRRRARARSGSPA